VKTVTRKGINTYLQIENGGRGEEEKVRVERKKRKRGKEVERSGRKRKENLQLLSPAWVAGPT